ncbi:DUF1289 domain-containing protein [Sphingomonas sp. Y38-1Y]|uniref:DUF1289 domain-containing protein n=1 Tax=Sphingomonas sp. Y38-1Y TaxID=3078265 RepID=UPI0028EAE1B2|nr:DUF1289 domain-containing protein [Sphingomonas sp. Y38-1Y]
MADEGFERVPPAAIETPCILVCMLDVQSGLCLGCYRTGEEIAGWTGYSPERRSAIMAALPVRRSEHHS